MPISQREVARRARRAHRGVLLALADLVTVGVVNRIEGGRDYLVAINDAHLLTPALRALFEADADCFREIQESLVAIAHRDGGDDVVAIALFGSVARAEERLGSGLDLLIIARDQAGADRLLDTYLAASMLIRERFGAWLKPIAYSLHSARQRWRAKQAPFSTLARDAVVLVGAPLAEVLS